MIECIAGPINLTELLDLSAFDPFRFCADLYQLAQASPVSAEMIEMWKQLAKRPFKL
jgi:hypothetical protein